MKIAREYISMIESELQASVTFFQEKADLFRNSDHNREASFRYQKEAERLQAILSPLQALLESDQEFYDLR